MSISIDVDMSICRYVDRFLYDNTVDEMVDDYLFFPCQMLIEIELIEVVSGSHHFVKTNVINKNSK